MLLLLVTSADGSTKMKYKQLPGSKGSLQALLACFAPLLVQAVSLLQLLLHPRFHHHHMLLQLAALVSYFSCPWQNI